MDQTKWSLFILLGILCYCYRGELFVPYPCQQCKVDPPFLNPLEGYYRGPILSPDATKLLSHVIVATTIYTHTETTLPRKDVYYVLREIQTFPILIPKLQLYIFHNHKSSIDIITSAFPLIANYTKHILIQNNGHMFSHSYHNLFHDLVYNGIEKPTAFIFLEEDMLLKIDVLASWANDNVLLEPLNYFRSFIRLLYNNDNGCLVLADQTSEQVLEDLLIINASNQSPDVSPQIHEKYIMLKQPYCAMFVASYNQMKTFVDSPLYHKQNWKGYGIREQASSGIQFAFPGRVMIPLEERISSTNDKISPTRPSPFAYVLHQSRENPPTPVGRYNTICPEKLFIQK